MTLVFLPLHNTDSSKGVMYTMQIFSYPNTTWGTQFSHRLWQQSWNYNYCTWYGWNAITKL